MRLCMCACDNVSIYYFCCCSDEMKLRKKIEQLQQYRIRGVRTLKEAEAMELEKLKKVCGMCLFLWRRVVRRHSI